MRLGVADTKTMLAAAGDCVVTVVVTVDVPALAVSVCVPEQAVVPVWLRYALRATPLESVTAVAGSKVPQVAEKSTGYCTAAPEPLTVAGTENWIVWYAGTIFADAGIVPSVAVPAPMAIARLPWPDAPFTLV